MTTDKIHPGHALLRQLIPDVDLRREFVKLACQDILLIDVDEKIQTKFGYQNWTHEQINLVFAFIESI